MARFVLSLVTPAKHPECLEGIFMLPAISVERERHFEKNHLLKLKQYYLQTDVLEKVATDEGYRDKLNLIQRFLGQEAGWILDIGSHTCGEDEYLGTLGYQIICTEINEYALDVSRMRSIHYGRDNLKYVACDGHHLPFKDASIHFVMFNESLHHMMDVDQALAEAYRVLAPGGKIFFYEPYAFNPYRRLSEVRDYFKGTIEKSFGLSQLNHLLTKAGFSVVQVERHVEMPSRKKLERLPQYRQWMKKIYYAVSKQLPHIFGMVAMLAEKPGEASSDKESLESILRCPITGSILQQTDNGLENTAPPGQRYHYADLNGIPVLVPTEAHWLSANGAR